MDSEQRKRRVKLIAQRNSTRGTGSAVYAIALLSALPGCDRGGIPDESRSQSDVVQEKNSTLSERDVNAAVADDPLFQGKDVVVHEYGDDQGAPDNPPPLAPSHSAAVSKMLRGAAIRQAVTGHELTDGVHWSWRFGSGGRLLAEENGRRSKSRWHVDGDELCIDAGYGDRCHAVSRQGRILQLWRDGVVAVEAELN